MGRMGEFEDYERDCQRRRVENSSEYQYMENKVSNFEEKIDKIKELILDGVDIDGAHHKQEVLVEIGELLGLDMTDYKG